MSRNERGFALSRLILFLFLVGVPLWYGWLLLPIYNTEWKVEQVFDSVTRNMPNASEDDIRRRLPALLDLQYVEPGDLPQEFFSNLEVDADGRRVRIATHYTVTVWPLGPVKNVSDWQGNYDVRNLDTLDRWRHMLRLDLEFAPQSVTPGYE